MDDLRFVVHRLETSMLDMLATTNTFGFRANTRELLRLVYQCGGYIAGGFGTIIARHLVKGVEPSVNRFKNLDDSIRMHLRTPDVKKGGHSPYVNAGCGDIDVWFSDAVSLAGFMHASRRHEMIDAKLIHVSPTVTDAAVEHIIEYDARVQVITRYLADPTTQIASFDVYNGMVAVTNDSIIVPEHWVELENASMLHVATWTSPWTINRFFKWMDRKGYVSVTQETAHHVVKQALAIHERWCKGGIPEDEIKEWHDDRLKRIVTKMPDMLQRRLQCTIPNLSGEELLQLSTFFKPTTPKYDYAMRELHRRMPLT